MDDAVLFACGTGANTILTRHPVHTVPVLTVDPLEASLSDDPMYANPIAHGDPGAMEERLRGVRVSMAFAMLGSKSGTESLLTVADCARNSGCKVISIVGIPWEAEPDHRDKAMQVLGDVLERSDRTFLMDVQTIAELRVEEMDPNPYSFFKTSEYALGFAIRILAGMTDGPFFSTLPEKAYTFSYVNDIDPAEAVQRALGATVFPTDPAYGKLIVTVSSGFGTAQIEQIFHTVVSNTGIIPDIVKRDDREDTKVLVFLPVRLTSPRASRS